MEVVQYLPPAHVPLTHEEHLNAFIENYMFLGNSVAGTLFRLLDAITIVASNFCLGSVGVAICLPVWLREGDGRYEEQDVAS